MKIVPVPNLSDNYAYLLIDEKKNEAAVIDPAEPKKILAAAEQEGITISRILNTHHHHDHTGGNTGLVKALPGLQVIGGDSRIPALTQEVKQGDQIQIGRLTIDVISVPCHTSGHVLYLVTDPDESQKVVFTGDTLFVGGCGRFFEGTAEQMYSALIEKIAKLPDDTKVYCGHEYTAANLRFAKSIEPENSHVLQKLKWAESQQEKGLFTIPSTVAEEKTYNPFMRVNEECVAKAVGLTNGIAIMDELRTRKNNFRG